MSLRLGALLVVVLMLHACVPATGRRETNTPGVIWNPAPAPPPVDTPAPLPPESEPVPLEPPKPALPKNQPKTAEAISGQAVVSLMRQAATSRAQGQYELSASQLERAQRIEPRNYFVWSALAKVYLDQEQYDQAISVAGKSNSLARGNVYVEVENWKTIAAARRAQGDSIGALQAEFRVGEIERLLGGS